MLFKLIIMLAIAGCDASKVDARRTIANDNDNGIDIDAEIDAEIDVEADADLDFKADLDFDLDIDGNIADIVGNSGIFRNSNTGQIFNRNINRNRNYNRNTNRNRNYNRNTNRNRNYNRNTNRNRNYNRNTNRNTNSGTGSGYNRNTNHNDNRNTNSGTGSGYNRNTNRNDNRNTNSGTGSGYNRNTNRNDNRNTNSGTGSGYNRNTNHNDNRNTNSGTGSGYNRNTNRNDNRNTNSGTGSGYNRNTNRNDNRNTNSGTGSGYNRNTNRNDNRNTNSGTGSGTGSNRNDNVNDNDNSSRRQQSFTFEVGKLSLFKVANFPKRVTLTLERANGEKVDGWLLRVDGGLTVTSGASVVVIDDLFFVNALRGYQLAVTTKSGTKRYPIDVQRSAYSWQLEQTKNRVKLTVEDGFVDNQPLSALLYLVTINGKQRSLSRPVGQRLTTGGSEFVLPTVDSSIDFSKGCYRWVVKVKDRAFFSREHGEMCRDS